MPRDVKIRVSYQADAAFLSRLARAVELDTARPVAWRKRVIVKLNELNLLFLTAAIESSNGRNIT